MSVSKYDQQLRELERLLGALEGVAIGLGPRPSDLDRARLAQAREDLLGFGRRVVCQQAFAEGKADGLAALLAAWGPPK